MDPSFYRSMTDVMRTVPAQPQLSNEALAQVGDPSASRNGQEDGWKPNEDMIPDLGGGSMPVTTPASNWWGEMVVDESTPKASHPYPHEDLSLPHPSLNLDFRMSVTLNPKISVGVTPFGQRNWISFTGGVWSGTWGSGTVLPGGQDNQILTADGSAKLETSYLLQTYDSPPAHIIIKTHGWRTGPPEILEQLADPEKADHVDPHSYKMRIFIEMETGDVRYKDKVNCGMWVGSGMRKGAEVIYDAYRVS